MSDEEEEEGVRTAVIIGGDDGLAHGWTDDSGPSLCGNQSAPNDQHTHAELCTACLPLVAAQLGTTVSHVLTMHRAPAGVVVPLKDGGVN